MECDIEELFIELDGDFKGYIVSSFGNVISKKTGKPLRHRVNNEYASVRLYCNGKSKDVRVHTLVAKYFIPNPQSKPVVNHIDGNKMNCHVSNLEWATFKENAVHASENGLLSVGENRKGNAKITEEQAWNIISLIRSGKSDAEIVRSLEFATRSIVQKIRLRQRWKHLDW